MFYPMYPWLPPRPRAEVPLMKRLPRDERPIVAEACEACEFQNGDVTRKRRAVGAVLR